MRALTFLFPCVHFFLHSHMKMVGLLLIKQAKPKLQWVRIISVCADGNLGFYFFQREDDDSYRIQVSKIRYYHYFDRCSLLKESCKINIENAFNERGMPICLIWNECCCFLSLDCLWVCLQSLLLPQLKQVDRFLTLLTAITPVFGKKQMVIRMEICSTARGGLITYQWRHWVKCV